jgi:endonuclease/exonuclease/phosphatase family metal-dependent hydrolase
VQREVVYRHTPHAIAALIATIVLCSPRHSPAAEPAPPTPLRVMSFNLAVGGEAMGLPLQRSADAIRAAGADVVGVQETLGRPVDGAAPDNGPTLARLLGGEWQYVSQPDHPNHRGILTRLPVVRPTAGKEGVILRAATGREVIVFNVHLPAAPYQPYLLCGIRYSPDATLLKTEDEAIRSAKFARGKQVDALLADVAAERRAAAAAATTAEKDAVPRPPIMFITGDFNEPSHLDWTAAAASAGLCPIAVAYPATRAVADADFRDAYRTVRPDAVRDRGLTWTPTSTRDDPQDRHDRIDFVFVSAGVAVTRADVVGEDARNADIVVNPWPSDHRAVVAEVELP